MKQLIALSTAVILTACASPAKNLYPLSEKLQGVDGNALACRFEKKLANDKNEGQSSNWYFWRQPQRTETRDELSNQGELWQRNASGQLFYTRLFYNERVAVEFVPGDLKATDTQASWPQISSLIDPNLLGKELALTGKENLHNMMVEYYSGPINGISTEVDWLPALQLPARIAKKLPNVTVLLTLSECNDPANLAIQPISKAELDGLRHIDYTDMGDMELDPMVQRIQQLMENRENKRSFLLNGKVLKTR